MRVGSSGSLIAVERSSDFGGDVVAMRKAPRPSVVATRAGAPFDHCEEWLKGPSSSQENDQAANEGGPALAEKTPDNRDGQQANSCAKRRRHDDDPHPI